MSSEVKRYDAFDGYGSAMPGKFIRESDYAALEAENARLRAELDAIKAQKPVGEVVKVEDGKTVRYDGVLYATAILMEQVEHGTKLYARPPASPDVERLVKALDQLANGSHLDAAGNHDDDSLREIARSCTCGEHNRLLKHADRVDAALAAHQGEGEQA